MAKSNDNDKNAKSALVSFIVQNFHKFIANPKDADPKAMLMLIAALSVLNIDSESSHSISAAKRLAQSALTLQSRRSR